MYKGFYIFINDKKEYFVITEKTNKTSKLCEQILQAMNQPIIKGNIEFIKYRLQPAICETKTTSSGRKYFDIYGSDFGGYGSFLDDNKTVIINL